MKKFVLVLLAAVVIAAFGSVCLADDAQSRADGTNVLVVYLLDGPDRQSVGKSDSQQVAEFYAQRRGVPAENLLGLALKAKAKADPMLYRDFFELVLKPVSEKLAAKSASGATFADNVCYIVLCPDMPMRVNTAQPIAKDEKVYFRKTITRSLDGFLISIAANLHAGVNSQTGGLGNGSSGMLGSAVQELTLPIYGQCGGNPNVQAKHFRQLRKDSPLDYNFYLVNRLGVDKKTAIDMIDGGLYAERFLRLPGPEEKTDYRPAMWFDQKYDFQAADHVGAMSRAVAAAQGAKGSPFFAGKGLLGQWPLVIDNQHEEIGLMVFGKQHKPTVSVRILDVDESGLTLWYPGMIGSTNKMADVSGAYYFPPGCQVTYEPPSATSGPTSATASAATPTASQPAVTAKVVRLDGDHNRLLLDSTKGFAKGGRVVYEWPGQFPADNCFYFYGFYGLSQFEDVSVFSGAIGIHVDSDCLVWARGAMGRGIAATFGVVGEPLSIGIPHGQMVLMALALGGDWGESCYNGLQLSQRWTGLVFGDPLYAPFRSQQIVSKTPPVLGPVTVKIGGGVTNVTVSLAGKSEDELADVALFRIEYGPTAKYGQTVEFYEWPEPNKSKLEKNKDGSDRRRFGYSRHFAAELKGLAPGSEYHYRITARNPAGLETSTADATFKP